jgi:toxin ParE1/3/4
MTPGFTVLPAADRDLDEQAAYLAKELSLETALRFYDAAAATFEQIARMPSMGERWDSTKPRLAELRVWRIQGFESHLIFYRPASDGVEIVRLLHGARDIDRVLESDEADSYRPGPRHEGFRSRDPHVPHYAVPHIVA